MFGVNDITSFTECTRNGWYSVNHLFRDATFCCLEYIVILHPQKQEEEAPTLTDYTDLGSL